jgi:hypothetical protein
MDGFGELDTILHINHRNLTREGGEYVKSRPTRPTRQNLKSHIFEKEAA